MLKVFVPTKIFKHICLTHLQQYLVTYTFQHDAMNNNFYFTHAIPNINLLRKYDLCSLCGTGH